MQEVYKQINESIKNKIEGYLLEYPHIQNKEDFILGFILGGTSEKGLNDEISLLISEANRVIAEMNDKVKRATEGVNEIEKKVRKLKR